MRSDLCGLTFAEFAAWGRAIVGHSDRFHRAGYRQVMGDGISAPGEIPAWREAEATRPGTITTLSAAAQGTQMPMVVDERVTDDAQRGRTTKLLLRLGDGREVESVLIPMGADANPGAHHTVCVSSQVGCRMGCAFCHTATMGLVRSLTAAEIVGQVVATAVRTGIRPRNVVFMGMGEPLDNLDAVAQAVRVLTDVNGWSIAHDHVTVSTVGRVDGLARLESVGLHRVNLAVSLFAADDTLRGSLMPVNRTADLATLKAALLALRLPRGRRILVSVVVIPGINDAPAHLDALLRWIDGLEVLVNLIPFNPIPSRPWRAPTMDEMRDMHRRLMAAGVPVRMRLTKGAAVMAACGQLGTGRRR